MSATVQPQWADAKAQADKIRMANARTKKAIRGLPQSGGFVFAAGVLRQPTPEQEAMPVFGLITSVRGVGESATANTLRRAGINNPTKRLRDLTPRQRRLIADWMDFEAERRTFQRAERDAAHG